MLVHALAIWQASNYEPRQEVDEIRLDVRMMEAVQPPPPPPKAIEPPPPPPLPKPAPKPPKELPRQAPLPVLAAAPAPASPAEAVVPVQPPPAPLPPIDVPPPPPVPAPVAAPPPAVVPPVENVDALISTFGREVSRGFESAKTYPRVAQMRNQQGKLLLLFEFADGELVGVSLKQSSGHTMLDQSALDTARKLKFPPLAGTLARRSFSFTLPVEYRLQ